LTKRKINTLGFEELIQNVFVPLAMGDTEAKHPKLEARFISKVVNIYSKCDIIA
jgi:hypothetical protein